MSRKNERCDRCTGHTTGNTRLTKQIYDDGGAYCHRCGYVWKGTNVVELLKSLQNDFEQDDELVQPLYNWRTHRRYPVECERTTILNTYQSIRQNYVAIRMTRSDGVIVGFHNRSTVSKDFFTEGDRGISFVGDKLTSSPSKPIIIVEGPWDCISERHVCVYGMLTKNNLSKHFKLQHCWLQPDVDVIDTADKRRKFEQMIRELVSDHMVFIQGYIIGNGDPDEATVLVHRNIQDIYQDRKR